MRKVAIDNPPNRFMATTVVYEDGAPGIRLEVYDDATREIVSKNDSPDVGFTYSVNPYRGCAHACAYCYARPTHEYLSFGAGTDFETRIVVKRRAAELLRRAFDRPSWTGELLVFSGNTDCYQPLEAELKLTRACLEVCAEYHQPVGLVTKGTLVERDVDLLQALAREASCQVNVSIPFWDEHHARAIEPYVATPRRRIQTIERLAKAGIPVGVNVAPVIPGLGDQDMVKVLEAAAGAGATHAAMVLLRLPATVQDVFQARLATALPLQAERVMHRVRETRGGALYDARFGVRGRGVGPYAEQLQALFDLTTRRLGLGVGACAAAREGTFRRPPKAGAQLGLF